MKRIFLFVVILGSTVLAQENRIAEFTVWHPLPGNETNFQIGYRRHLQWRRAARDSWEWNGWKITSGPRAGQFLIGTLDHYWSDFEKPLNPVDDMADKTQNVIPFAEQQSIYKVTFLKNQSLGNTQALKSRQTALRMITLKVSDISAAVRIADRLKSMHTNNSDISFLLSFKKLDGGEINELIILIGFETWELFGKSENLQEQLIAIESGMKLKLIQSIRSETLIQQPDLTMFPGEEN